MNWYQIKCNWQAVSEQIKLTWGKLSEDDLATIAGSREQFATVLHERYGYARSDAEARFDQFASRLNEYDRGSEHTTENAASNSI